MGRAERENSQLEEINVFSEYLNSLGNPSVFTFEEEQEIFHRYHAGLAMIKATISSESFQKNPTPSLPTLQASIDSAKEAFNSISLHNQKLVVSIAKHGAFSLPIPDRVQNGNFGLHRAIDRFDPSLGNRFSTFATPWIKSKMTSLSRDQTNNIHVPIHLLEDYSKLEKFQKSYLLMHGCLPTDEECQKRFEWTQKKLDKVTYAGSLNKNVYDFDLPISDNANSSTFGETISDPILKADHSIENSLYKKDYGDQMEVLDQALDEISKSIESGPKYISMYIEHLSFPEISIDDLAEKYSCSRTDILKNLANIHIKLRKMLGIPPKKFSDIQKEKRWQPKKLSKEHMPRISEINLPLLDTLKTSMRNGARRVAIYIEYNCDNRITLQDIGTRYGVSRERIRQIIDDVELEIQSRTKQEQPTSNF